MTFDGGLDFFTDLVAFLDFCCAGFETEAGP
jgi:hypothetical protein